MTDNTYRVRTAQNYLANKLTADHDGSTTTVLAIAFFRQSEDGQTIQLTVWGTCAGADR